ncbi:MAG: autotransporter outer membrane beta-barrel domain-containing protein [Succinivibrio sp.]|nr:autotransporter outer membrane beta-barrel domain-containing protein [Succinivibrio sp.]
MRRHVIFNYSLIASMSITFGGTTVAYATDTLSIPFGSSSIQYVFYNQGEIYDKEAYAKGKAEDPGYSTWQLTDTEKQRIAKAGEYWSSILGDGANNTSPVKINVSTFAEDNAQASSQPNESEENQMNVYTAMQRLIIDNVKMEQNASIMLGPGFRKFADHWSQMPLTGLNDATTTIIHEMGHALGITSFIGATGSVLALSSFDRHLQDYFGTKLTSLSSVEYVKSIPDTTVLTDAQELSNQGYFVAGQMNTGTYGVWFKGDNLTKVMTINGNAANSGTDANPDAIKNGMIRIEAYEETTADFSHLELRNSLMSHQDYRNWTSFMEAELAVLQDIGYTIDRRNFFGFSIYNDGLTYTNKNPFYARNSSGTAYITGKPNTSLLGVGLHLYGSNNTVYQAADLLADGVAGTGIRIDGSSNTLTINSGVKVTANGDYGNALLVSYGKENTINHYGTLEATGTSGIAARFDFGHNLLLDADEYRGSYIHSTTTDSRDSLLYEINGELVRTFNVAGTLNGSLASIYISDNAYVQGINILTDAQITGDIISKWDPDNSLVQTSGKYTSLDSGRKLDNGAAIPDSSFNMTMNGGIYGYKSLKMTHHAGKLGVTGPINVYSLDNKAYLAIHDNALIKDTFTNKSDASLEFGFYGNGSHNTVTAGSYSLNGTLVYRVDGGYFKSESYNLPEHHNPFGSVDISALTIKATNLDVSPTLKMSFDGDESLIVNRPANAYSQHGDRNGASVGRVLPYVAENAQGRMKEMIASIDFSGKDGSGVSKALTQLSPQAVDASSSVGILTQQSATYYLNRHIMNQVSASNAALANGVNFTDFMGFNFNETQEKAAGIGGRYDWRGFIIPFASYNRMESSSNNPGYKDRGFGVLAGADRRLNNETTMGFHIALSSHNISVRHGHDSDLDSVGAYLGAHMFYTPEDMPGYYFSGLMRFGVEDNDIERNYNANGYSGKVKGDYKNKVAALGLQAGKDFYFGKSQNLSMGPVGYLNYTFVHRPSFKESGDVFALKYDSDNVHSLSSSLGGHVDYRMQFEDDTVLGFSFLTLWNHEYLSRNMHSKATFVDYDTASFESTTRLPSRDSLLFQGGIRLNFPTDVFIEGTCSYTLREHGDSLGGLIRAGWEM